MSQPEKVRAYAEVEPLIRKAKDDIDSNSENELLANAGRDVLVWGQKYQANALDEIKEGARNSIGSWIIKTFCLTAGGFALAGGIIAIFQDESHMKNFTSVAQTIGAMLSGAVGFVLGHYFTNKDRG